jgi:hypothetical protein
MTMKPAKVIYDITHPAPVFVVTIWHKMLKWPNVPKLSHNRPEIKATSQIDTELDLIWVCTTNMSRQRR